MLNNIHEHLKQDMKGSLKLNGKITTLVQDKWSNIHNEPVIISCL